MRDNLAKEWLKKSVKTVENRHFRVIRGQVRTLDKIIGQQKWHQKFEQADKWRICYLLMSRLEPNYGA